MEQQPYPGAKNQSLAQKVNPGAYPGAKNHLTLVYYITDSYDH